MYCFTFDNGAVNLLVVAVSFLDNRKAAYVHIADVNGWYGAPDLAKILDIVRPRFSGVLIANGGLTFDTAARDTKTITQETLD